MGHRLETCKYSEMTGLQKQRYKYDFKLTSPGLDALLEESCPEDFDPALKPCYWWHLAARKKKVQERDMVRADMITSTTTTHD